MIKLLMRSHFDMIDGSCCFLYLVRVPRRCRVNTCLAIVLMTSMESNNPIRWPRNLGAYSLSQRMFVEWSKRKKGKNVQAPSLIPLNLIINLQIYATFWAERCSRKVGHWIVRDQRRWDKVQHMPSISKISLSLGCFSSFLRWPIVINKHWMEIDRGYKV